jgi:hypothetical protein
MTACDEPAASGVAPPAGVAPQAGVAPPPTGVAPRTPGSLRRPWSLRRPAGSTVTAESKPVVVVSTVTRQLPRPVVGHPWSRECRRTQTHPSPGAPRWSCRK